MKVRVLRYVVTGRPTCVGHRAWSSYLLAYRPW
jgi:hypothetical protein